MRRYWVPLVGGLLGAILMLGLNQVRDAAAAEAPTSRTISIMELMGEAVMGASVGEDTATILVDLERARVEVDESTIIEGGGRTYQAVTVKFIPTWVQGDGSLANMKATYLAPDGSWEIQMPRKAGKPLELHVRALKVGKPSLRLTYPLTTQPATVETYKKTEVTP